MSTTLAPARWPSRRCPIRAWAATLAVRAPALVVALIAGLAVGLSMALAAPLAAVAGDLVFQASVDRTTVGL